MSKINCWDFFKCGRQAGGEKIEEFGDCPASNNFKTHGVNNGINGGRSCWAIAGTFCSGEAQGSFVDKVKGCASCSFFHLVKEEEGRELHPVSKILKSEMD